MVHVMLCRKNWVTHFPAKIHLTFPAKMATILFWLEIGHQFFQDKMYLLLKTLHKERTGLPTHFPVKKHPTFPAKTTAILFWLEIGCPVLSHQSKPTSHTKIRW